MKTFLKSTFLIAAGLLGALGQTHDTTPPTLTALTINPSSVNATSGRATVTVSFSATDDLSGVLSIFFEFQTGSNSYSSQGDLGTGTAAITVPQYAPSGTYNLFVGVTDAVGNVRHMNPSDLTAAGFPSSFTVQ